ncbi:MULTISPECIES: MBL fold metallo-hydrolase [unclassified Acidithiobacillus]|uniref:MBL fold metallo-hydrolase n=1 Tax=unclassified Acidithiobacillus TaxID=2614800 RepID=UPI001D0CE9F1|nr:MULTISPECIES: MBL fold metallo-hydrolase [unclassified Acidithiobacillus]
MIFRQLFEAESATYTYLFGCTQTGQAVLLDPVLETVERDLQVLHDLGLRLSYTLETHIHADHVSSARKLTRPVSAAGLQGRSWMPCPAPISEWPKSGL